MSSQDTVPDDTLYQVFKETARLATVIDDRRSIKMIPSINLQDQQIQRL
jgi:hypothetical protein